MPPKLKGILYFLLQCFTVSLTLVVVRFALKDINIFVMTFIQSLMALILILPFADFKDLRTGRMKLHVIRNIFGLCGTSCFFYGVTKIPLNDATAISFTAPLFTTLAAVILLREKVRLYSWAGMVIGLLGAGIILRPSGEFDPNYLWIIASVILMSFVQIFISQLNKTEPVKRILFYMISLTVIMTAPFAAANWVTPHWANLGWIFVLTMLIFINLLGIILAYRHAEINMLMPLDFSRLIFTAIIAYLVFNEHLQTATILGSIVILTGIVYALFHERREHKQIPEL